MTEEEAFDAYIDGWVMSTRAEVLLWLGITIGAPTLTAIIMWLGGRLQ